MIPRRPHRWSLISIACLALLLAQVAGAATAAPEADHAAEIASLRTRLGADPTDTAGRFRLARLLAWSGDHAGALQHYAALRASHPDDVDFLLGEAQVLAWSGDDDAALDRLARARALAPEYEDVWRLELAVLERADEPAAARLEDLRGAAARRFPAAGFWRVAATPPDVPVTRIEGGFTYESLTDGLDAWHSEYLRADRWLPTRGWFLQLDRHTRFDESDGTATAGAEYELGSGWRLGGDFGVGPGADFLPRIDGAARVARTFAGGWGGRYEWRYRDYADATVDTHSLTAERYLGRFRGAYMLSIARLHGGSTNLAHTMTVNYFSTERSRYSLTVSNGEEAESIAPGVVRETDINSVTVTGRHGLTTQLDLSWWIGIHEQGDFYRRRYVGLALAHAL